MLLSRFRFYIILTDFFIVLHTLWIQTTPCKHPVIVLKDILFRDLVALIEFMYQGEVRVGHDGLPSFLRTAEVLRVRGLTEEASRQNTSQLAFSEPPPTISSQTHNLNTSSPAYSSPQLCQYGSHHVQVRWIKRTRPRCRILLY